MIIDNFPILSSPTSGDELPIERGTKTYKIDYDALATAILNKIGAGTDGIVNVANGGTGLSASPSLLVNLASAAAADVMQATPRPGVTGTLPVGSGGTGAASAAAAWTSLGVPAMIRSTATTLADFYGEVKDIPTYRGAVIYITGSGMTSLLTGGKLTSLLHGLVIKVNDNSYEFMVRRVNTGEMYLWRISNFTSASSTPTVGTVYRLTGAAV